MSTLIPYERSFASHERAKYWSKKNGDVKPEDVFKQSNKKYWFDCDKCSHCFDCALNNIVQEKWCPYCKNKKLCENLECIPCFNKSFASHKQANFWSDKNGDANPRNVLNQSNTKYLFDCDKCSHCFDCSLSNIVQGKWCPYCSVPPKQLCEKDECISCFNKSFASHEKVEFWSEKNGDMKPQHIFKSSGQKYWFKCHECKHSFDCGLNSIVSGTWCPYCANQKLCENLECIPCFNKSFASHEKAKFGVN